MQLEVLQIALSALRANLLRSLLTMLGIVIGVAAVIAMIALGDGAQQSVHDRIAKLGTTLLQIDPQRVTSGGVQTQVTRRMTIADVRAIEERAPHVAAVQAQQDKDFPFIWGTKSARVTVNGVSPNFLVVRNFEIDRGEMFSSSDDIGRQRVVVLGGGVPALLGIPGPDAILGEKVRIGGIQFVVVGTLKAKGGGSGFGSTDDEVFIPFETSRYRLFKTEKVDDIYALAATEADLPDAMAEIGIAIRRSHRLRQADQNDFRIRNQADFLQTLGETAAVFTTLLAGIAAVSLLVGGIGIMNIMLVSVTERTREIGIRKALGATKRNILFQFLIEAVTLCLLGGTVGIAAGVGGAVLLRNFFGWSTAIGASSILMAFVFAAGVGILFGVWPARRASSLDPIEALRYE